MRSRIYITGAGIISAIGKDKEEVLKSLLERKSGISGIRYLECGKDFPVGEVKMSNEEMEASLGIHDGRMVNRTSLLGMMAIREAAAEAGIGPGMFKDIPLISGTTVGGMEKSEKYFLEMLQSGICNKYFAAHDCGSTTELIADYFGGAESITTISTACSSAANALIRGADMILSGKADIVIAGGTECLSKFHLMGFNSLMILDREPCRPFDKDRAGLNLGEGAGFVVLESGESVRKRGSKAIATLEGWANRCDAFHQTASSPDGEGAWQSMSGALEAAGLQPEDISYINAHGTGTPNNDASESAALKRLFSSEMPPVSSTKAFTGHTTSASGSIEAIICILAMQHSFIPANLNWKSSGEDTVIPYTGSGDSDRNVRLEHVLCNSFGFGGNDSSLVIGRPETDLTEEK